MTNFQNQVISLIKSALLNKNEVTEEISDWSEIIRFAFRHQIVSLIYYGVIYSGINVPKDDLQILENMALKNMSVDINQIYAIKRLEEEFNLNQIEYMLLKGSVLKHIYPKTDMRTMGDIDILIRTEQYEKISDIMIKLGYSFDAESSHDFEWTSKFAHIELHKSMIPPQDADFYKYFHSGWEKSHKCSNNSYSYSISDEDQLIYVFTHFAKHYRSAGIGIRHMLDLWIILKKYPQINQNTVFEALESIGLLEFYKNIIYVLEVWFDNKPSTEKSDYITEYIFESGAYGLQKNRIISKSVKKSDDESTLEMRAKHIKSMLFPNIASMKLAYPILKKFPFLLPAVWIFRFFKVLIFKRGKIAQEINNMDYINSDDVKARKKALDYVGLKYVD